MRKLIESLNQLTEARGTRFIDRVAAAWQLFLRDVGDALAKEMQDAGYESTRLRGEGGSFWADFKPRPGFKFAESDFVPPRYVKFWIRIDRDGMLEGTIDLADKGGIRDTGRVNLIDAVEMPEAVAGHLAGGDRMDVLGTWG
jgi:hypothetical protein